MSSKVPVFNQVAWTSLIIQLVIICLFYFAFEKLAIGDSILMAALLYCLLAFILRKTIAKSHRMGIKILKQHQYKESIPYFEKSIVFFEQNSWVDTYRFITLLSSSKLSYKEMGLCNIAFAYSQIGEGEKAIIYYEKAKAINPSNGLAIAGLNMLNSIKQK
jgi:tetratricopeptide (TPR) repeat protein